MLAKRLMAFLAVPMLVAGMGFACPDAALAQDNSGTTDVTVQAGPDWGQTVKTVKVEPAVRGRTVGDLAKTGDPAFWGPVALVGAAMASGGLLLLKRNEADNDGGDDERADRSGK